MSMDPGHLYNDVNLLPAWYVQAGARRLTARRQMALIALMVAGMAGLLWQTYRTRGDLLAYHQTIVEQVQSTKKQITEVLKLEKARSDLMKQLRIHRDLHQPINYSQITGTLGSLLPHSVAVKSLQMKSEKVTLTRPMTKAELAAERARTGKNDKTTTSHTVPMIRIEMDGLAPSDVEVANLIGSLAGSKLFQNVKMLYSKQGTFKGSDATLITREFRIRMEVPLDVEYQPAGEVARAR